MSTDIKADYPEISGAAQRFAGEAERIKQIAQQLRRSTEALHHTWTGQGAQKFQQEMTASILPEFQRLTGALIQSGTALINIEQIFQTAEEEAARLLQMQAQLSEPGISEFAQGFPSRSSADASGIPDPPPPSNPVFHFPSDGTVSLAQVAAWYEISVTELMAANGNRDPTVPVPSGIDIIVPGIAPPAAYGITFAPGEFTAAEQAVILQQVQMTAQRLRAAYYAEHPNEQPQLTDAEFFKAVYGSVNFAKWERDKCATDRPSAGNTIHCSQNFEEHEEVIVHELGHFFDYQTGGFGEAGDYGPVGDAGRLLYEEGIEGVENGINDGGWGRTTAGYIKNTYPHLQHCMGPNILGGGNPGEDFADMFMNWVRGPADFYYNFADDPAGQAREAWMAEHMPGWIHQSLPQSPADNIP